MAEPEEKWFYKFRQLGGSRPAGWVIRGPFKSYDEAMTERQNDKKFDSEVSDVFPAASREDAESIPPSDED